MRFSERRGYKKVREALQRESMDDALRNGLWNAVDLFFCRWVTRGTSAVLVSHLPEDKLGITFRLWTEHLKETWDSVSGDLGLIHSMVTGLRTRFFHMMSWHEVFDLLEFLAEALPPDQSAPFTAYCNDILEAEKSAYRFLGTVIDDIIAEEEIRAIEMALQDAEPLTGVRAHLQRALELHADRDQPDYRNAIKESISAVEALACLITRKPAARLGDALREIEQRHHLHPALRKAFDTLYGYTSDEEGVRHKMLEEDNVGRAEAQYMLVACSAFVSYLISKAADAGINLSKNE